MLFEWTRVFCFTCFVFSTGRAPPLRSYIIICTSYVYVTIKKKNTRSGRPIATFCYLADSVVGRVPEPNNAHVYSALEGRRRRLKNIVRVLCERDATMAATAVTREHRVPRSSSVTARVLNDPGGLRTRGIGEGEESLKIYSVSRTRPTTYTAVAKTANRCRGGGGISQQLCSVNCRILVFI